MTHPIKPLVLLNFSEIEEDSIHAKEDSLNSVYQTVDNSSTCSEIKLRFGTLESKNFSSIESKANWSQALTSPNRFSVHSKSPSGKLSNFSYGLQITKPVLSTESSRVSSHLSGHKKEMSVGTDEETCSFQLSDSIYSAKYSEFTEKPVAIEHTTPQKSNFQRR